MPKLWNNLKVGFKYYYGPGILLLSLEQYILHTLKNGCILNYCYSLDVKV